MRAIHVLLGALAIVASTTGAAGAKRAGGLKFDSGVVNVLTDDSFDTLYHDGFAALDKPAIIIFTIPHCRQCHSVLSSFREAANGPEANAYFFHVDTVQQLALNERFAGYTHGYPFIVMIKGGNKAFYVPSWPIGEETIVHFISKGYKVVPAQSSVTGPLSLVGDAWARHTELSFEQKMAVMCLCILVGALGLLIALWVIVSLATRPATRQRVHAE